MGPLLLLVLLTASTSDLSPRFEVEAHARKDVSGWRSMHSALEIERFERDGYLVVPEVLSPAECEAMIDEIWATLEPYGARRDEPASWEHWPESGGINLGIFGVAPHVGKQAFLNRQNPKVYEVFRSLMQHDELWVTVDRLGVLRPTVDAVSGSERLEWRSKEFMHWDLNPFRPFIDERWRQDANISSVAHPRDLRSAEWYYHSEPAHFVDDFCCFIEDKRSPPPYRRIQGFLALTNSSVADGGFHMVPGFHTQLEATAQAVLQSPGADGAMLTKEDMFSLPSVMMDELRQRLVKVPVPAGSLVVWDSRLPHGNHANNSTNFRMVQYIRMMPVLPRSASPTTEATMRATIRALIPHDTELTELGRLLLRQKSWFGPGHERRVRAALS